MPGLDERIGNGFIKGSTTAIIGTSGTAKSTFAFQYIAEGVRTAEPGVFYSLGENVDEIRMMVKRYGYDIGELENNGLSILLGSVDDDSPDALISSLAAEIKRTNAKRLVIDSLSAFETKYKDDMYIIAKRIISLIQEHHLTAVITILTTQKSGFEVSGLSLFALLQNIILVRFVEIQGRMKRILAVLKMLGTEHDESILEFRISSGNGARILGSMDKDYMGIFTGVARRTEE
ncbi:MAG TPA: ATPase domain-containing protein [Bacteroidia bacterium]|nr:ATPase domain-containing protein [Bacteroidia bacterium]